MPTRALTIAKQKTKKPKSQVATRKPSAKDFCPTTKSKPKESSEPRSATKKSPVKFASATKVLSKAKASPIAKTSTVAEATSRARVLSSAKAIPSAKAISGAQSASSPLLLHERLARLGFQPIAKILTLPEYAAAGLKESDTKEYLPSLSINTVEEFLGLIRGATAQLAEDLETTEDKLVDLYNAAVASQLPAMSAETMDTLEQEEYSFGLSLESPPPTAESMSFAAGPGIETDMSATASLSPLPPLAQAAVNLIDEHMPPIRDQGKRGTCVAFSTCAVMEYMTSKADKPGQHLSEQYLYWAVKQIDSYPKDGTWLKFSFPVAKQQGTCKQTLWPYEPNFIPNDLTHGNPPNPADCAADALTNAFTRAIRLRNFRDPEAIKSQLAQGRPVAIGIPVFKSWFNDPVTRLSGNIHLPLKSDRFAMPGHAIVLVGYGDDPEEPGGGYFIVRNSWGGRWGLSSAFGTGYGYISYAYIERHNADAWTGVI